ncbi:MAG TPA: AlkA N-terminal domain-containing protein [Thermoanaerobaculia bacterium]|nr:AlkA N-terminal domain-containing protein [Thermoanaerobaculia bacterium]
MRLPFNFPALLDFLRARLVPGESIVDDVYRRGDVEVRFDGRKLVVNSDDPDVLARVHRLFDVDADVSAIASHFANDKMLSPLLARHPGLRVPGAWDPFETCVRAIVGQQVSVAGATTIMTRILTRYGTSPERIARARGTNIGMPAARWETIRGVARAAAEGDLTLERIRTLRGIGPWTASYIAMRVFRDADAFPHTDLGVRKAFGMAPEREILARAEAWRPWRAYAAMLLWRG